MTVAVAKVPMFAMSWVVEATPITRRFDPVAPLNRRFPKFPFVAKRFVEVVFVQVMFVGLKEVTLKVVAVRFEMKAFVVVVVPKTPFVTKMLDPVAFVKFNVVTVVLAAERAPVSVRVVPVAFANVKFWRVVRPETARAAMLAVPVTVRFVVAMFTEVAFRSTTSIALIEAVFVTVRFEVTKPPKRVTVVVADAPRWVTEARVSASVDDGQFVPFERQTVVPPTRRDVRAREVPVAFVKFRVVKVEDPEADKVFKVVPWVTFKDVPVAPFQRRFEMLAFVAKMLVEVVFVPVAFVQVMLVTFKVDPVGMVRLPVTVRFVVVAFVAVKFDVFRFVKLPVAAVRVLETKRFVPVAPFHVTRFRFVVPVADRFLT